MAEAKKDDKPAAAAAPKKKGGKLKFYFIVLVLMAASPFMMPTLVLLLAGMLPTFVALFTDSDPAKSRTAAVGAMNFAGVAPFLIDLWVKGHTIENALHLLTQSSTWIVMLGSAAIGELILFAVPQAMATATLARAESRLKILKENLEQLKAAWGPEVATTKPVEKIVKGE